MIILSHSFYLVLKIASFIFGAIWGSFANVLIYRIPRNQSIFRPSSHCVHCNKKILWYENIPILSYIILRGKCSGCSGAISIRYPVVELLTGILSMAGFVLVTGGGKETFSLINILPVYILVFYFCLLLLVITFIDLEFKIIPDSLTLPAIVIFFIASFFLESQTGVNWKLSGLGLICGGLIIFIFMTGYKLIMKREGMGGGDMKLMAMVGTFLGIQSIPFILFASSFQGILVAIPMYFLSKNKINLIEENPDSINQNINSQSIRHFAIPFGPFIALTSLEWLFFSNKINSFMEGIF